MPGRQVGTSPRRSLTAVRPALHSAYPPLRPQARLPKPTARSFSSGPVGPGAGGAGLSGASCPGRVPSSITAGGITLVSSWSRPPERLPGPSPLAARCYNLGSSIPDSRLCLRNSHAVKGARLLGANSTGATVLRRRYVDDHGHVQRKACVGSVRVRVEFRIRFALKLHRPRLWAAVQ
jgi:hypothetical protein